MLRVVPHTVHVGRLRVNNDTWSNALRFNGQASPLNTLTPAKAGINSLTPDDERFDWTAHLRVKTRHSTADAREFPVSGPTAWNSLPADVTSIESLPAFRRYFFLFRHPYLGVVL
jgi:hypothetical protein